MDPRIADAIQKLVQDLVEKRYATIAMDGRGGRLSEGELRTAVEEYGRRLVTLPGDAWDLIDIFPHTKEASVFSIDVPLWTAEEGRSDLTLSITATLHGEGCNVVIDDLHVL